MQVFGELFLAVSGSRHNLREPSRCINCGGRAATDASVAIMYSVQV